MEAAKAEGEAAQRVAPSRAARCTVTGASFLRSNTCYVSYSMKVNKLGHCHRQRAAATALCCGATDEPPFPLAALHGHGLRRGRGLCEGEHGALLVRLLRQLQDDDVQ